MSEEKKLTDEEIIHDLEEFAKDTEYGAIYKNALNLINRLQAEKEEIKNEYVKLDLECQKLKAENAEFTSNKFGNWKVKFFKAQEEIERLTEELETKCKECREIADDYQEMGTFYYNETVKTAELQKQVDELKELAKIKLEHEKNWGKIQIKQSVKDTAKEILDEVSKHFGGTWLVNLYKKYGLEWNVEVE